jgi:hypothetical protein
VAKLLFSSYPDAKTEPNLLAYNELRSADRGAEPPSPMEFSVEDFRALNAVLTLRKVKPQVPQAGGFLVSRDEFLSASGLLKIPRPGRPWAQFAPGASQRRFASLQALATRRHPLVVLSHPARGETNCSIRYAPILKLADLATWDDSALEPFPLQLHRGRDEGKLWLRLNTSLETRFHRLIDEDYIDQLDRLKGNAGRLSPYELAGVWWCYTQWKPELEIHRDKLARKLRIPSTQLARKPAVVAERLRAYYETWKALGLLLHFEMGRQGRDGIKDFFRFNPDKLLHLQEKPDRSVS